VTPQQGRPLGLPTTASSSSANGKWRFRTSRNSGVRECFLLGRPFQKYGLTEPCQGLMQYDFCMPGALFQNHQHLGQRRDVSLCV
jgi:hypothetical protein